MNCGLVIVYSWACITPYWYLVQIPPHLLVSWSRTIDVLRSAHVASGHLPRAEIGKADLTDCVHGLYFRRIILALCVLAFSL